MIKNFCIPLFWPYSNGHVIYAGVTGGKQVGVDGDGDGDGKGFTVKRGTLWLKKITEKIDLFSINISKNIHVILLYTWYIW